MIRINSLTKKIKAKTIVDGISFSVAQGSVFGLLGLNGAGKSTTIKTILGFLRPTSGSVETYSRNIGYLPENPYYYDYLTLRELLSFSLAASGIKDKGHKKRVEDSAESVGMADSLDKQLRTFSKGMVQRSGIAAALIHQPDLVILDEPMSGLDPLGRRMVFDLVSSLRHDGTTVLFCSHILNDAERLCDEIAIMDRGKIVREVKSEELFPKGREHTQSSYSMLERIFEEAVKGRT